MPSQRILYEEKFSSRSQNRDIHRQKLRKSAFSRWALHEILKEFPQAKGKLSQMVAKNCKNGWRALEKVQIYA